jgi:predicted lipoprotein with Yx(FWY)xxD motif
MLAIAGLLAGSALAAMGAGPSGAATANAANGPTVRLERTNLGKILVDGSGYTLYLFTRDRRRSDRCAAVSGCIGVWPALTTRHRPVAGPGVRSSLLGTIKYQGDVRQVTYAGHPLYGYSGDFGPRSTTYVGTYEYGGTWYAVTAAGKSAGGAGF